MKRLVLAALAATALSGTAHATTFTETSPHGVLPTGVTKVGGIVTDLKGLNGNRVVAQLAASSLFSGTAAQNQLIGTQTGITQAFIDALGGGLTSASFRFTLSDGDTSAGNFDFNDTKLLVNGLDFGFWSSVQTQITNGAGTVAGAQQAGFPNNQLATGFFFNNNAATLADLFASLSSNELAFRVNDVDPGDNVYDFRQGVDGGLIDVGQPPVVQPGAVPEPATWAMMLVGFGFIGFALRRGRQQTRVRFAF